ncbi:hypothetical protein D9619_009465 [Psilocybe cf. subviscida]|uniref:Uncharacterized protein n=1 Tax=Psilocybe cf. subviscida TaxID=2480587 RepID=A0A8H5BUU3_9AGAR|nr:hypothetical protein D9619_009465 [Psilocybe cf. subviscida]
MEQDGEPDQPATPAPPADLSTGKVLLTMYTPSDHVAGYRHMLIPFPSSFVQACGEAVQCFREHLPANEVSMSLHQAVQRKDGEYVWSVITKDTWDTVLDKDCQEIGVFIHTGSHDSARFEYKKPPDANPPKRLVSFQFRDGYDIGPNILRVVRSFEP